MSENKDLNKSEINQNMEEQAPGFPTLSETERESAIDQVGQTTSRQSDLSGEVAATNLPANSDSESTRFAGFWMRFWAYLLDLLIIASIGGITYKPLLKALNITSYDINIFSPFTIGAALVFYLYFVLMTKFFSQTLGKMVFGLKVVSLKEKNLSWSIIIFREFIGRFISKTITISYLLVGFLPKKQGLHDIFADTSVIYEKKR